MKNSHCIFVGLWLLSTSSFAISNDRQMVEQGMNCAKMIENRLNRLACFDDLFETKISLRKAEKFEPVAEQDKRPAFWHSVVTQEKNRTSEDVFVSNIKSLVKDQEESVLFETNYDKTVIIQPRHPVTDNEQVTDSLVKPDIILTQSAQGTLPPRPVLVLSCIDNITRLQILLHKPIDEGMTPVTLVIDGQVIPSRWFSEAHGYLIRAGRGLPGIDDIRSMFGKKLLVIRSKTPELDNLSFDVSLISEEIKPLREACHW